MRSKKFKMGLNKKLIIWVVGVILLLIIAGVIYFKYYNSDDSKRKVIFVNEPSLVPVNEEYIALESLNKEDCLKLQQDRLNCTNYINLVEQVIKKADAKYCFELESDVSMPYRHYCYKKVSRGLKYED